MYLYLWKEEALKFLIVCKWNQIRSTFLAAYLNNLFPESSFESCGIEANEQSWSLDELCTISKNFGFEYNSHQCARFDALPLTAYTAIIAVDGEIFKFVSKREKGNTRQDNSKVINLEDFVSSKYLVPVDPGSNKALNIQGELVKLISAFINYYHFDRKPNIMCFIPKNKKRVSKAQLRAQIKLESNLLSTTTIDFNILDHHNTLASNSPRNRLNLTDIDIADDLRLFYLESLQNHFTGLENLLLDFNYVRKLIALSENQYLQIITPPLYISNDINSITLALSIPASKITVI